MIDTGESSSLKEALKKLDIASTTKPTIDAKTITCVCGRNIKVDWSKHTVEIL